MQPSSNPCFLQTILYRVSHPLFKSNHKYHYVRKYKGRLGIQVLPKLSVHSRTCMVVFRAILTYRITNLVLNSLIFLIYFFFAHFFSFQIFQICSPKYAINDSSRIFRAVNFNNCDRTPPCLDTWYKIRKLRNSGEEKTLRYERPLIPGMYI